MHSSRSTEPSPRALLLASLVFCTQAALFLVLLSWTGAAQQAVPAAHAAVRVRVPVAMPRAVSSFGAAELDGWLYLYGGHAGKKHQYGEDDQWDGFVRLRAADPATREELPGGPRLQAAALVAAGGELLRIGGMRAQGNGRDARLSSVASVGAYSPVTGLWRELASLPEPRSSHDAIACGGRVYVFGGWNLAGDSDTARWAEHGLVLDLARPEAGWQRIPQPRVQRGVALAASAREVFVLGGMDEQGEFSSRVDVLDVAAGTWREAAPFPEPGFGLAGLVVDGELLASGRGGALWRLALDPAHAAGGWEACGELFVPRMFHRLLPGPEGLLALGGSSAGLPVGWIEHLRPDEPAPLARFELPFAGRARQRQALFAHENTLFSFGGNVALEQHAFEPGDFLAEAWRIELGSGTAQALPSLPAARQSMVCVAAPGAKAVYALGGFGHDGAKDRTFDSVWRCALDSGAWEELDVRLPRPMTQFRALVRGSELHLLGGMDFDREREGKMQLLDTLYTAELADLEAGFRDSGVRLPAPRRAFGAALLGDTLYLAGGLDESFEAVAGLDAYDFARGAWTALPAPRAGRLSPELIALGGKLYLVAGLVFDEKGSALPAETIEEFDPARGTWRELPVPLPLDPHEVQAFVWHDRLALVSTWNERGVLELALLDPDSLATPD